MSDEIKILITGDTHLGGGRVKKLACENNTDQLFGDFLNDIMQADLSITNLESPLIINDVKPIKKTGPSLKSPSDSVNVLKSAGFDLVTLANNHIMDYGQEGLFSTLKLCNEIGIKTVGAAENLEKAKGTFYKEINGIRIAILNFTENEFSTTTGEKPGAHPLNIVQNHYSIKEAKSKADFVIVIVHGGHEYYPLPSPRMKETYRYFVDIGADAVIGHHPHCFSGFEEYNNAPIIYSLGNFLFDKEGKEKDANWHLGIMAILTLSKKRISFEIKPYIQNHDVVGLRRLSNKEFYDYKKSINQLNKIISQNDVLENEFNKHCRQSKKMYLSYLEPHSNRVLNALQRRNLVPSLFSKNKKRLLLNLIRCEAHRDILLKLLSHENSHTSKSK